MILRCCWVLMVVIIVATVSVALYVRYGGQDLECRIVEDGRVTWQGPCSQMPDLLV
jgi:hypothetical protein